MWIKGKSSQRYVSFKSVLRKDLYLVLMISCLGFKLIIYATYGCYIDYERDRMLRFSMLCLWDNILTIEEPKSKASLTVVLGLYFDHGRGRKLRPRQTMFGDVYGQKMRLKID